MCQYTNVESQFTFADVMTKDQRGCFNETWCRLFPKPVIEHFEVRYLYVYL